MLRAESIKDRIKSERHLLIAIFALITTVAVLMIVTVSQSEAAHADIITGGHGIELARAEKRLAIEYQGFGAAFDDTVGSSTVSAVEISRTSPIVRLNNIKAGDHLYMFVIDAPDEIISGTWKVELFMNGARVGNTAEITQKVSEEGREGVLVIASLGQDLPYGHNVFEIKVK